MENMTAILFCGGRGSRLYPVTDYYQKVMMPVGTEGKPLLEYVIRWLSSQGITKYVALIRYRANQIRRYFGDGSRFGVQITYVVDKPHMNGTGGALLNAKSYVSTSKMLIYYTDIISNFNMIGLYNYHLSHKKTGTVLLDRSWILDEDIVQIDDNNQVTSISNTSSDGTFVNTGISILDDTIFNYLSELADRSPASKEIISIDLSSDVFPHLVKSGQIKSYFIDDWWLDVGSITRHQLISDELLQSKFKEMRD